MVVLKLNCCLQTLIVYFMNTAWKVSKYGVFSGPYSVLMRENKDQKKLRILTLFTHWKLKQIMYMKIFMWLKICLILLNTKIIQDFMKLSDNDSVAARRIFKSDKKKNLNIDFKDIFIIFLVFNCVSVR